MSKKENFIENYNYVPFKYFKHLILFLIILIIVKYNTINSYINKFLNIKYEENEEHHIEKLDSFFDIFKKHGLKIFILFLPVIMLIYYDINYSSFSIKNLGVNKVISNSKFNYLLRVFGAYGIIQILAQDLGLKTGYLQREITQSKPIQFLLFFGTAYAITNDRSEAFIGAIIYFILKYGVSNNKTSTVCFEDV